LTYATDVEKLCPVSRAGAVTTREAGRVDRRVLRTRSQLRDALLELAETRELDDISVADISARAEVNRATFYLHYADRDALLLDVADTLMVQTAAALSTAPTDETDPLRPPRHTLEFFNELGAHAGFFGRILGPNGSAAVLDRMEAGLREAIGHELERSAPGRRWPGVSTEAHAAFMAGAILGLARHWLAQTPRTPASEVALATWALASATVPPP
jgi:AcrR family transcriptional regulator